MRRTLIVLALLVPALAAESQLTPREREAFRYLQRADKLEHPRVGIAGAPSHGFVAMIILNRSRDADAAFKKLVRSGTMAGKLYGLIGVYRTDRRFFDSHVKSFAASSEEIGLFSGCVIGSERVSSIVDYPNAERTGHADAVPTRYVDIAHGGYSAMFFDAETTDPETAKAIRTYKFPK